jgi:hypothetical protein
VLSRRPITAAGVQRSTAHRAQYLEPSNDGFKISLLITCAIERIEQLARLQFAVAQAARSVPLCLPLDQLAERLGDRSVADRRAEVSPDVIRHRNAGHPFPPRRRRGLG